MIIQFERGFTLKVLPEGNKGKSIKIFQMQIILACGFLDFIFLSVYNTFNIRLFADYFTHLNRQYFKIKDK
jgi:hypothetical protein